MKLYKALKLKKKLVGEIAKFKEQIEKNNSYLVGSINSEKYDTHSNYELLQLKINELINLKLAINTANQKIQLKIYELSELKALISFWNDVSCIEGSVSSDYSTSIKEYKVHYDDTKRNHLIEQYQDKVDKIQEEIDTYNYTTDISI